MTTAIPSSLSLLSSRIILAIVIVIACFGLFSLDKDITNISQLITPKIFIVLAIYFTPPFILSVLLHQLFIRYLPYTLSMILSLGAAIPLGFALVIGFFRMVM